MSQASGSAISASPSVHRRPLADLFPTAPAPAAPAGPTDGPPTFYGLVEPPFTLSSDPKFFYHSTPHDAVAQRLLTAIRDREGVVVLTGDIGTGKTTLCRAVIEQLDRRTLTSFVGDPFVSGEELLKTILVDFGVVSHEELSQGPFATRHNLSVTLKAFIESLAPLQASAVVMIDEAQNLPPDVLEQIRMLSEADGGSGLLQVVLIGQPSLTALLRAQERRPTHLRVSVRTHLTPLPANEIGSFVDHRLSVAAVTAPRVQFDEAALAYLYELSQGVPRVVNLLCDRALARGHEASAGIIDLDLMEMAAEDLDIGVAPSAMRGALAMAASMIALVLLVLLGAAVAASVFREAIGRGIAQWEKVPAPPAPPARHLAPPARPQPPQ